MSIIYKKFTLNDFYFIFLFYINLNKKYKNYLLYYIYIYNVINVAKKFTYSLKYII